MMKEKYLLLACVSMCVCMTSCEDRSAGKTVERWNRASAVFSSTETPLSMAVKLKAPKEVIEAFIKEGANVNPDFLNEARTPLWYAVGNEDLEVVKLLLDAGAKNIISEEKESDSEIYYETVLQYAAAVKNYEICKELIKKFPNGPDLCSDSEGLPISILLRKNYKEKFIGKVSSEVSGYVEDPGEKKKLLDLFIENMQDINVFCDSDTKGMLTPLEVAAMREDDKEIFSYLIEKGADTEKFRENAAKRIAELTLEYEDYAEKEKTYNNENITKEKNRLGEAIKNLQEYINLSRKLGGK